MRTSNSSYFYLIYLSYETPSDIMNSTEEGVVNAREELLNRINSVFPEDKYELFLSEVTTRPLDDSYNQLITYQGYFRAIGGLPMSEYINARSIKNSIMDEFTNFFNSVGIEYKQINIKPL